MSLKRSLDVEAQSLAREEDRLKRQDEAGELGKKSYGTCQIESN